MVCFSTWKRLSSVQRYLNYRATFIRKGSRLDIAYSLGNTDLHWTVDISGLAGD